MNKVGVTYHPKSEAARRAAEEVRARIAPRVPNVWLASAWDDAAREQQVPGTDLLICCGGDGTVLRAARAVVPHPVALLGVNLGRIGFLTETTPASLFEQLDTILEGGGRIERRAMFETETRRNGEEVGERSHALNDVVVGRAAIGRTVQFAVRTDGTMVGTYRADGVIIATATGSTAYSLSVGGPILYPESREIIVTPVAPHLAPANSVVLPEGSRVEIEIAPGQQAILSIDGQGDMGLAGGDAVAVRTSEHVARFLRLGPPGDFYLRVGRRLNWLQE
ncbi:MAG: NAD(+)/NADH kinase [Dehalococcoidia bacterium]